MLELKKKSSVVKFIRGSKKKNSIFDDLKKISEDLKQKRKEQKRMTRIMMETSFEALIMLLQKEPIRRKVSELDSLLLNTQNIKFFANLSSKFGENIHLKCVSFLEYYFLKKDDVVFHYGSVGYEFFIIIKGSVKIFIPHDECRKNKASELAFPKDFKEIKIMKSGESFGELALINNRPRLATIVCNENTHFATLKKKYFQDILYKAENMKFESLLNKLSEINFVSFLTKSRVKQLFLCAADLEYPKGKILYNQNANLENIYVLKDGVVRITKDIRIGRNRRIKTLEILDLYAFSVIGNEAITNNKHEYSASVISEIASVYVFRVKTLIQILKNDSELALKEFIHDGESKSFRYDEIQFKAQKYQDLPYEIVESNRSMTNNEAIEMINSSLSGNREDFGGYFSSKESNLPNLYIPRRVTSLSSVSKGLKKMSEKTSESERTGRIGMNFSNSNQSTLLNQQSHSIDKELRNDSNSQNSRRENLMNRIKSISNSEYYQLPGKLRMKKRLINCYEENFVLNTSNTGLNTNITHLLHVPRKERRPRLLI